MNAFQSELSKYLNDWVKKARKVYYEPDVADLHDLTIKFFKKQHQLRKTLTK